MKCAQCGKHAEYEVGASALASDGRQLQAEPIRLCRDHVGGATLQATSDDISVGFTPAMRVCMPCAEGDHERCYRDQLCNGCAICIGLAESSGTSTMVTVSRLALAACLEAATSNPYLGDLPGDLAWLDVIEAALAESSDHYVTERNPL